MNLTESRIRELADQLDVAERDRRQIRQFSLEHPSLGFEEAYAIQQAWVELKIARGNRVKGHKIGLTSRAMQRAASINEPDYGALLEDMFFADGADVPMHRFIEPKVEVELAFVLKDRLAGPDCTLVNVLDATHYVIPALEIIDARLHRVDPDTKRARKVFDTIADNAANAGVVLGGRPVRPMDVDLRWVSAILYRNGVIEDSGVAAAVLNHPANGPAWLARKLHVHAVALEPGEVILGGSFTSPIPATAGDTFHADYGPLGSISVRFA